MSTSDRLKAMIPGSAKKAVKKALGIQPKLDPDWQILNPAGPVREPHVVFDVGAYKGGFIRSWLKWCPQAEIHAFEPTRDSYAELNDKYGKDARVKLIQSGVGDSPGKIELNVSRDAGYFNSFLAPDSKSLAEVRYETGALTKYTVPVTTLDEHCLKAKIKGIHLIKIDVQGFELNVLRGATQAALPITNYVFVESGIRPLYVGAPRFSDVFNFITPHGFHLIGMRSYHRGNLTLVEADMLFRRDSLMPPLDADLKVDKIVQNLG